MKETGKEADSPYTSRSSPGLGACGLGLAPCPVLSCLPSPHLHKSLALKADCLGRIAWDCEWMPREGLSADSLLSCLCSDWNLGSGSDRLSSSPASHAPVVLVSHPPWSTAVATVSGDMAFRVWERLLWQPCGCNFPNLARVCCEHERVWEWALPKLTPLPTRPGRGTPCPLS